MQVIGQNNDGFQPEGSALAGRHECRPKMGDMSGQKAPTLFQEGHLEK